MPNAAGIDLNSVENCKNGEDATPEYDRLICELQLVSHTLDIIDDL